MATSSTETESFDATRRRLCPDGACIGVLDDAGLCKVCGIVAGEAAAAGDLPPRADQDEGDGEDAGNDAVEAAAEPGDTSGFDPARRLCPEGSCVGVLDADGRCPVCGRRQED